jgi:hypothetical protein
MRATLSFNMLREEMDQRFNLKPLIPLKYPF